MGAHLKYKLVDADQAQLANEFITDQPEHEQLEEIGAQPIYFAEEESPFDDVGEGQVKASAGVNNHEDVSGLWASIFQKIHDHDELAVKVLASSCALRLITFSLEELNQVTNHGDAISGPQAEDYHRMISKANEIDSFPTPFVSEASESDNLALDLDRNEISVLDIFLTFHMETLRMDMIVNHVPMEEEDIALPITQLVNKDILIKSYDVFYRLNRENETVQNLLEVHNRVIETGELPVFFHTAHSEKTHSQSNQ